MRRERIVACGTLTPCVERSPHFHTVNEPTGAGTTWSGSAQYSVGAVLDGDLLDKGHQRGLRPSEIAEVALEGGPARDMQPPDNSVLLNPDNPFEAVLVEMVRLHRAKSNDYARDDDPLINFRLSADQVQAVPGLSCEVLIGTKQARLRELLWTRGKTPKNESVRDTLIDRCVYSVIAVELFDEGGYEC
jgi:hypothetical protein